MESYLVIKSSIYWYTNESQNIMLSERNQTHMSIHWRIPFIWNINTEKMNTLWKKSESCGEFKLRKRCREGFPDGLVVKTLPALSMQGVQVQFLVQELRSHRLHGMTKNTKRCKEFSEGMEILHLILGDN